MRFPIRLTSLVLPLSILASQAWACTDRDAAVAAFAADDFVTASALQEAIAVDPTCDDAMRLWVDEGMARHYFSLAGAAQTPGEKQRLLQTSADYYAHWRTYAALADLARTGGDRAEEARLLQAGINQMNDGPAHHSFSQSDAAELIERASTAMLLADTVVAPAATRSGAPGGIFIENLRGFQVQEVELAIEFDFDSTQMTPKGQGYADQLLDYLKQRTPDKIVLEGHTDPVGASEYNQALSLRRAQGLRDYLIGAGYSGVIEVVGRGESNVPDPLTDMQAGSPEHHQIARRVKMIRG